MPELEGNGHRQSTKLLKFSRDFSNSQFYTSSGNTYFILTDNQLLSLEIRIRCSMI